MINLWFEIKSYLVTEKQSVIKVYSAYLIKYELANQCI